MLHYLIRVQLPDRPGALGAVASRIGSVGGDVISIDILQRTRGVVVDELGVGLAGDHLVRLVRDEILEVDGVSIESFRQIDGALPDRDAELLAVATGLFSHPSAGSLLADLAVRSRRCLAATFSVVVAEATGDVLASDGAVPSEAAVTELVRQATELVDGDGPGEAASAELVGEDGPVEVAAVALAGTGALLVVGREEPLLRPRERQWVAVLAELADHGCQALVGRT